MPLNRAIDVNGGIYRHHIITGIRHVAETATHVYVASFAQDGSNVKVDRGFVHELDDTLTFERAYEWIATLPEFAEVVDERDEIIAAFADQLTDEQAAKVPWAYREWAAGESYEEDERVRHGGELYRVLQAHDSQEGWEPDAAPSLFARVLSGQEGGEGGEGGQDGPTIGVWEQPDSTNPYMAGARVHFPTADDPIYESTIDNNVWSPADYPAGWTEVAEEPTDEPTEEGAE